MVYLNVSKGPVYVSKNMVMTRIAPGAEVNLSMTDIRHTKSSMRYFESSSKRQCVIDQKAFKIDSGDRSHD